MPPSYTQHLKAVIFDSKGAGTQAIEWKAFLFMQRAGLSWSPDYIYAAQHNYILPIHGIDVGLPQHSVGLISISACMFALSTSLHTVTSLPGIYPYGLCMDVLFLIVFFCL